MKIFSSSGRRKTFFASLVKRFEKREELIVIKTKLIQDIELIDIKTDISIIKCTSLNLKGQVS